jgi:hypothetical protein
MKKAIINVLAFVTILMVSSNVFCLNENNPKENLQKANVSGKVFDKQTGESLAGVLVMIKGPDIKVYTDLEGNFTFKNIEPGIYTIEVNYISYSADELKNVVCNAGNDVKLNIEIRPN